MSPDTRIEHKRNSKAVFDRMIRLGFQKEFAMIVSNEMCTNYTSKRMCGYLDAAAPRSMEEVADEMLIILEERDRYKEKIENRHIIW